jgi:hypothetical protein
MRWPPPGIRETWPGYPSSDIWLLIQDAAAVSRLLTPTLFISRGGKVLRMNRHLLGRERSLTHGSPQQLQARNDHTEHNDRYA